MAEITFGQPANITPAGLDQLVLSFPFTVREIGKGALRDKISDHRVIARISGTMLSIWGFERSYSEEVDIDLVKILFEFSKEHVLAEIGQGNLEDEYEIKLFTNTAPEENPYDPAKIPDPVGAIYTIEPGERSEEETESAPTEPPALENALNRSRLSETLDSLNPEELSELAHNLDKYTFYWMGDPTQEKISTLRDDFPILEQFIDFDIVIKRLESLDSFERGYSGVHLRNFLPEIFEVSDKAFDKFKALSPGIEKAEYWLLPRAKNAAADADIEAAVYFASRGRSDLIDVNTLRKTWHHAVCDSIISGMGAKTVPQDVLERAQSQTISLAEAVEVLEFNGEVPRFFSFRDADEDFIDAAFVRAVDWFGITGYEAWLKSFTEEISKGPEYGSPSPWWFFHLCRSDLALRMADNKGLEAFLWAFTNGQIERDKPWRIFWADPQDPKNRDYLPTAATILFSWHRINPTGMNEEVLNNASKLLNDTQMGCGAWPLHADSSEPDLLSTCFAIHGLVLHKPEGWQTSVARSAGWLTEQQDENGFWFIEGGPAVMLTVLVLDSLALAGVTGQVTFNLADSEPEGTVEVEAQASLEVVVAIEEPTYDYRGQEWYNPDSPAMTSVNFEQAHQAANPQLAIIVATEIELRQVLRIFNPLAERRQIWKVAHSNDTYYLGRFGEFESVVLLSEMGSGGTQGSILSTYDVIRAWDPAALILVGIAFGTSHFQHRPADVLIANCVIPYELQRLGENPSFRSPTPPSSSILLSRFRNILDWSFTRPDGSTCVKHIGAILSGEKLVDNEEFKNQLIEQYPNAIGGEMEGAGLYAAANRARKDWIIAKGVCDWADGRKHDDYQEMAAASSVSLCHIVFSDPNALDGV